MGKMARKQVFGSEACRDGLPNSFLRGFSRPDGTVQMA